MDTTRNTTSTSRARIALATTTAVILVGAFIAPTASADRETNKPGGGHCARIDKVKVPGAEHQEVACLDDLTTAGTGASGHTIPANWAGLNAAGTTNPTGVPGIQVDGYFPDTSTTNTNHGWNHDSQFVIRIPDNWNGGLVVSGSPGNRATYANDFIISDWVLAKGYAFAATDKGNTGLDFYRGNGTDGEPGGAEREWNSRVTELTVAAQEVVRKVRAKAPKRTYLFGISNGGYLVRWQLENRPELYDGGLDWEGTLFRSEGPNVMTYLPTALQHYPAYAATGDQAAHDAIIEAGFEPGSEFLWPFHHAVYWDLTQRIYRESFDPTWDGDLNAGIPYCASGTPNCDADYDYASRPDEVKAAVASVENTGRIGKPLITVQGTLDTLLPISTSGDPYDALIDSVGHGDLHRYYRITDGTHTDALYGLFPEQLRPMLPCARTGFDALVAWVETGAEPPADRTVPRPSGDLLDTCSL